MATVNGVELDDVRLAGERLVLRRWEAADADAVHAAMADPSMHEFLAVPDPYTRDDAVRFVTDLGHEGRHDGSGAGFAVTDRADGRLLGAAVLRLSGDPEIGYWVAPDERGHGHAAEATRMLARWGFDALGLARVGLVCDVENVASARTALAAGFAFEGVSRDGASTSRMPGIADRRSDLARFARLARDPGRPLAPSFPSFPAAGVTDGVIRLRLTVAHDAEGILQSLQDPESVRWGFTGVGPDPEDCRARARRAGLDALVGRQMNLALVDEASGAYAGALDLRAGPPGVADIGYTVHPAFRGRRYTTRALRLIAGWAFGPGGLVRLQLGAKTPNVASQRAALAAGFAPDGVSRSMLRNPDGTFSDEARFALLASDTRDASQV